MTDVQRRRFFAKMVKSDTGCWEWKKTYQGHRPMFFMDGKLHIAARVMWEVACGPIQQGMNVCHKCDNPNCVRADHLFLGTHEDNMADMWQKGRTGNMLPAYRRSQQRGARMNAVKFKGSILGL